MKRACGIVLALLVLGGCATPPAPRYYTLDMSPSGNAGAPVNIDIQRLRESEALARKDILIKKSPTEIEYYAAEQWAATLGELVRQKLDAEFGPGADKRQTLVLSGTILDFGQVDTPGGAQAHVRLALEFRPADASLHAPPLFKKTYDVHLPAKSSTPQDVVVALSEGLERIAADVAADVSGLQ